MNREPTEEEKQLMERYGIEAESRTVYHYKGHTYEKLEHAIRYAKIDAARCSGNSGERHSKRAARLKAFCQKVTGRVGRRSV